MLSYIIATGAFDSRTKQQRAAADIRFRQITNEMRIYQASGCSSMAYSKNASEQDLSHFEECNLLDMEAETVFMEL